METWRWIGIVGLLGVLILTTVVSSILSHRYQITTSGNAPVYRLDTFTGEIDILVPAFGENSPIGDQRMALHKVGTYR